MNAADSEAPRGFNPVFWLMWALPAATVVAGFATLFIAMGGADRALPATYHWEGVALDADLARGRKAVALGVAATLEVGDGACVVRLTGGAPPAERLELEIASGSDAALDLRVSLPRTAADEYRADCAPVPSGRWWVSLRDPAEDWALRARLAGTLERSVLRAGGFAANRP